MSLPDETSWTLIEAAARGDSGARVLLTERYLPPVRAYLAARWKGTPLSQEIDDAVQEVFVDLLRPAGGLDRLDPGLGSGFRAFLYGMARNAALHAETRRARDHEKLAADPPDPDSLAAREASLSRVFDREWARALLKAAAARQAARARERGPDAVKRTDLLRLRFQEGKPIREIALEWNVEAARLHHDYARARREFLDALREVIGLEERCSMECLEAECSRILELLR